MVKASEVKKMVKEGNKRISKDAIEALEKCVIAKVSEAIKDENDGRKTLDAAVINKVFGVS